jgi:hypothetical protein
VVAKIRFRVENKEVIKKLVNFSQVPTKAS